MRRPAGIAQAQQLRALVESFACGVVEGLAEQRVVADAADAHELGVAARDEQRDERKLRRGIGQQRREQMAFEVVHADRRHAQRVGEAVGGARADQQRAGEPGPFGVGDGADVGDRAAPLRARIWRVSGRSRRMWSREASSGTTPP